jgi:hypothetical protein
MIPARRPGVLALIPGLIPGLIACVAVALVAVAVQALEVVEGEHQAANSVGYPLVAGGQALDDLTLA